MTPAGTGEPPHLRQPIEVRFWNKVDKTESCWTWTAGKTNDGYGIFTFVDEYLGPKKKIPAHRWAYQQARGPIPPGLQIDHLCRNRACVNPAHLEAVTQRENIMRGVGRGAQNAAKTHCAQGHEFTPENTAHTRRGRLCRECRRAIERQGRARRAVRRSQQP